MEITIFRKNEITLDLFKNQLISVTIHYSTISSLKREEYGNFRELDETKTRLDLLDKNAERLRRAAAKYLHEYELVKVLCKKQVISRAYFKLYEMVYFHESLSKPNCTYFFICEAPGGFIECVTDIRRKKNLKTEYISISKYDNLIKYSTYLDEESLVYGDITDPVVLHKTINNIYERFPEGMDFITADGGFDVKVFIAQEIICSKLLLCEIYLALSTQKKGGTFVIKFFDMFTHNSIIYYLLLCSFYSYVKIIKPKCSRNCNSERYLICYGFNGADESILHNLYTIIIGFQHTKNTTTIVFPNFNFKSKNFNLKKLSIFNNLIIYEQIKTINESIKMVNTKNTYIQNLLLNMFINKTFEIKIFTQSFVRKGNIIYKISFYDHCTCCN